LGVAAAKIDLAAESALSIPVTGPLGAVGAAYGAIGASGNIAAGGLQLVGAATGNLRAFGEAANVATTLTTVGGFTVSLATRGNRGKRDGSKWDISGGKELGRATRRRRNHWDLKQMEAG